MAERCEPCSYYGDDVEATTRMPWDDAPVCDWHANHSWSAPRREASTS